MKKEDKQNTAKEKDKKEKRDEIKELRERLEDLQEEKEKLFGKLQRVSADYSNFQKRVPKQIADSLAYEKEAIIKTLLPALDNFEHTLQNARNAENTEAIIKGIEIVYGQLLDSLRSQGVEQINALDTKFDPSMHEAIMQKPDDEKDEGTVLEEFQKGYKLNGRVIRPNKVVVSKQPAKEGSEDDSQEEEKEPEGKQEEERKDESNSENEEYF